VNKLSIPIVSEHDNTDVISFQIQRHSSNPRAEFNHLTCLNFGQTEDSGNTITNTNDSSEFLDVVLFY
jgi:hypothetical protein